jgi:hypothetical protein
MKTQELNNAELQEVNGGSYSSATGSGLLGSAGIGNLISFGSESQNGDQSQASAFSAGNGISTGLGGIFSQMGSSL